MKHVQGTLSPLTPLSPRVQGERGAKSRPYRCSKQVCDRLQMPGALLPFLQNVIGISCADGCPGRKRARPLARHLAANLVVADFQAVVRYAVNAERGAIDAATGHHKADSLGLLGWVKVDFC